MSRRRRWREMMDFDGDSGGDPRYIQARKRAHQLRVFYGSLGSYVFVNIMLFVIDALTGGGWWFYWVTIFWGLGLFFQAMKLFNPINLRFDDEWEERKVRELMGEKSKHTLEDDSESYFEESQDSHG